MVKKKSGRSATLGSTLLDVVTSGVKKIASSVEEEIRAKQKIHHYFMSWVILSAALFIVFYGLAVMLDSVLSWYPGLSYIVVGAVFVLIALVYRKYY